MEFYSAIKEKEILSFADSEDQKSYVLHMRTLDLGKYSNVVGVGSHVKGRAHMGDMGIGRKPKI
jgi:hypothetical protein